MPKILGKTAYINKSAATRANKILVEQGYPEIEEGYLNNIMQRLGGADRDQQKEVYEMISVALGFDLIDGEGYEYTPKWLT